MITPTVEQEVDALDRGQAYAELQDVVITIASGDDARRWLNDLVTTDVETLDRFASRPSLLLTPTGRIRATLHVLALGTRDFALAQPGDQPDAVADLLGPYVLSSDVTLSPSRLRIFAVPGRDEAPGWLTDVWRPSIMGGGFDLLVGASDAAALQDVRDRLAADGLRPAGSAAIEARRVARAVPAFPRDIDGESLPSEAGLDSAPVTDRTKGCFLGQEAVAKVANLGHPNRVVLPVVVEGGIRPGETILANGRDVGSVTSALGGFGFARVRWDARELPLATASGAPLRRR